MIKTAVVASQGFHENISLIWNQGVTVNRINVLNVSLQTVQTINNDFLSFGFKCMKLIKSKLSKNRESIYFEVFAWSFCMVVKLIFWL